MRGFSGLSPRQSLFAHVVEAAVSATSATSLQTANAAAAAVPPEGEELGRPLERQGSWLFDSATGEYAWVPPDAIGWAAGHVLDHAAGEAVAHVLDIVKTGAGGIAGAALGLETDNPGAVPKENVVYMPEQTVTVPLPKARGLRAGGRSTIKEEVGTAIRSLLRTCGIRGGSCVRTTVYFPARSPRATLT
jgi:hypothetical protein